MMECRGGLLKPEKSAMPKKSKILARMIQLKKGAPPSRSLRSASRRLAGAQTQTKRGASLARQGFRRDAENGGRDARAPQDELNRFGLDTPAELRRRAERHFKKRRTRSASPLTEADAQRLLHELEVHQIELQMQNAELRTARDEAEAALDKYTDLYDFAPVGYFTIAASGTIQLVNLTGARMFGIDRSRLLGRVFGSFVSEERRPVFDVFLKDVFAGQTKQSCDLMLVSKGQPPRAVNIEARRSPNGKECRAAVVDITERKRTEEAQRRIDVLAASNQKLEREIVRRQAVEEALKQSERHSRQLLEQSRHMQEQLRLLSRQVLSAQEDERKKISRELHDVIAQTLTGITVRLAALKADATVNTKDLERNITRTQQLVEHSVNIVHRFARELRPTVLDDLGLIPALHTFMKGFREQTGIRVSLSAVAAVEQLNGDKRTALYRVAQEALTNVARHAQASQAEVRIQKLDGAICMKIKDNGKGFQEEHLLHSKKSKRLGLLGMRERVEMASGNFTIKSAPGKGTTILAQIPFSSGSARGGRQTR